MARKTKYLQLHKPDPNEFYNVETDQNQNFDKIDTKIEEMDNLLKGKEEAFAKKSGFNLEKSDDVNTKDSNKLATSKAVADLNEMKVSKNGDTVNGNLNINGNLEQGGNLSIKKSAPYIEFFDERTGSTSSGYVGFGAEEKLMQLINRYSDGKLNIRGNGNSLISLENDSSYIYSHSEKLGITRNKEIMIPTITTSGDTDANNIVPNGDKQVLVCRVESYSHATTNFPIQNNGLLISTRTYSAHVFQRFISPINNIEYTRTRYGGSWTPWKKVVTDTELKKYSAFYLTTNVNGMYSSETPIQWADGTFNNDFEFVYSNSDKSLKCTQGGLYKIHLKLYINILTDNQYATSCICRFKKNGTTLLSYFEASDHRNNLSSTVIVKLNANDRLILTSQKAPVSRASEISFVGGLNGALNNIYIERLGD